MAVDQHLLEVLRCVQCRGTVVMVEGGRGVLCEACQIKFPVQDDMPVMLFEEAIDLKGQAKQQTIILSNNPDTAAAKRVTFHVQAGPKQGMRFALELGTCKALGRAAGDPHKTNSFHVDVTLSLDDATRKVIQQYVSKQFRRTGAAPGTEFGFRRTGDVVLDDVAVSRVHAMIFYDDAGVGVLDLVSRNGTYVNGAEVESRLLQPGDVLEVGGTKILVEKNA